MSLQIQPFRFVLILLLALICLLAWMYFTRHHPEADGQKAREAYCHCEEQNTERLRAVCRQFLQRIKPARFQTQEEAQTTLQNLFDSCQRICDHCNAGALQAFHLLKDRYQTQRADEKAFEHAYEETRCDDSGVTELEALKSKIQKAIFSIHPPLPDTLRIRRDLMGERLYAPGTTHWWNFDDTGEIKKMVVYDTVFSENHMTLLLSLYLVDRHNGDQYDGKLKVHYNLKGGQWEFRGSESISYQMRGGWH